MIKKAAPPGRRAGILYANRCVFNASRLLFFPTVTSLSNGAAFIYDDATVINDNAAA